MVSNPLQNSGKLTSVFVKLHKPASAQHGLDWAILIIISAGG